MGIIGGEPAPDYYALKDINRQVNERVHGQKYDDCEWYTTFKQIELNKRGIPSKRLYVSTTGGDQPNHVVAQVGDWILDNRYHHPLTRAQMLRGGYKEFPDYIPGAKP